jgi:hypothetical protein
MRNIKATVLGRNVVSKSSSGAELIIQFLCEAGHAWQLRVSDHSAAPYLFLTDFAQVEFDSETGEPFRVTSIAPSFIAMKKWLGFA